VNLIRALLARCSGCNGWGGYWFGKSWRVCETCNGSGTA
jgi:DnaJ-class molecular chaperone